MTRGSSVEDNEDLYLEVVDVLARRSDQLQAASGTRGSLGPVELQEIVLFLSGGLASGILSRFGERISDGVTAGLVKLAARARRSSPESNDDDHQESALTSDPARIDQAVMALAELASVLRESSIPAAWTHEQLVSALMQMKYSSSAAEALAKDLVRLLG